MKRQPLCARTLRSVARRMQREWVHWVETVAEETYGSGLRHGMAEMCRRTAGMLMLDAKAIESAAKKKAGKRC